MTITVSASSSPITATASGSTVAAAVGTTIVSASSSGGIGPQGPQGEPGEGVDGEFLPLSGGTMTGNIVFDGTGGQYIGKGLIDTSRGGYYGISLVCSVNYQFNWQAGWIVATEQDGTTPRPLYVDSGAGTTLRVWDAAEDEGVEIAHDGITFADNTTQTTAAGTVSVAAPLTNTGTAPDVSIGLTYGGGLTVYNGALVVTGVSIYDVTGLSDALTGKANASHSHGSITSDGKIGTTSGRVVVTTTNGLVTTASTISASTQVSGLATVATSGSYADLSNKPTLFSGAYADLSGKPTLGTAAAASTSDFAAASHTHTLSQLSQSSATTGQVVTWNGSAWAAATPSSYTLPVATSSVLGGVKQGSNVTIGGDGTISVAAPVTTLPYASITGTPSLATVATTGAYSDLSGLPTLGTAAAASTSDFAASSHTHAVSALTQSGATTGQAIAWNGSAWAPATVSGGGSATTSASDLTSGTLSDARLSTNAQAAVSVFFHPFLLMGA